MNEYCDWCDRRAVCVASSINASANDILCVCVKGFTLARPEIPSANLTCGFNNRTIRSLWYFDFCLAALVWFYLLVVEGQNYLQHRRRGRNASYSKSVKSFILNSALLYNVFIASITKIVDWDRYIGTDFIQTWCFCTNLGFVLSFGVQSVHDLCKYLVLKQRVFQAELKGHHGSVILKLGSPILLADPQLKRLLVTVLIILHQIPPFMVALESIPGPRVVFCIGMIWVIFLPVLFVQIVVSTNPIINDFKKIIALQETGPSDNMSKRVRSSMKTFAQKRNILLVSYGVPLLNLAFALTPTGLAEFEYIITIGTYPLQVTALALAVRNRKNLSNLRARSKSRKVSTPSIARVTSPSSMDGFPRPKRLA